MPRKATQTEKKNGKTKKDELRLVSKSAVKDLIATSGLRTSHELLERVDGWFRENMNKAIERCKANGRATVRPEDL
jgi:histone H3/H4